MSWLRISYAWYKHSRFEHGCDLDLRKITLDLVFVMVDICAEYSDLIIGRCSGNEFSTAKWPVTSALDICDTLSCHGGNFLSDR